MMGSLNVSFLNLLHFAARALRAIGPYALLELVMPGGTVIAVLLYFHQHRAAATRAIPAAAASAAEFRMGSPVDSCAPRSS